MELYRNKPVLEPKLNRNIYLNILKVGNGDGTEIFKQGFFSGFF